jgi:hypothetical protein
VFFGLRVGLRVVGRENQVGALSQRAHRNTFPCVFAHDYRVVAATDGSLGKMGHVRFIVRPRQPAFVTNATIRAHGHNEFEFHHSNAVSGCQCLINPL